MCRKTLWFFILAALVFGVFYFQNNVNILRDRYGSGDAHYTPSEGVPILLLGGFRAVVIDLLWIRGIARHLERKYYESMAINNLIARLQPDFPGVWIFQAWNMAYNIAHEWESPETKWKWVKGGIEFAKNGAAKNPSNGDIAFELGHMYLNLFDARYFKYGAYYRQRLKEERNEDNYDESVAWFRRSVLYGSKIFNPLIMERMVCHALWQASLQAEREGRLDDALEYVSQSIDEWKVYKKKYPDDPMGKAQELLPIIEQKRDEITKRMRK